MASRDPPYDPYIPAGTGASGGEYSGQNAGNTRTAALQAVGASYVFYLLQSVASIDTFLHNISNFGNSHENHARDRLLHSQKTVEPPIDHLQSVFTFFPDFAPIPYKDVQNTILFSAHALLFGLSSAVGIQPKANFLKLSKLMIRSMS